MIIELLFNLIGGLIKTVFIFINLPDFPESLISSLNYYLDLIFNNLNFLGFFFRGSTISTIASIAVTLFVFTKLYHFIMWIWRKLPISSS